MHTNPVPNLTYLRRYRPLQFLGEGGMSTVYQGEERGTGKPVVIKVMKDRLAADAKCREAFRREIDLMTHFRHPYAVELFAASLTDPNGPCVVMELVMGIPLNDLLAAQGKLTPARVGTLLAPLGMVIQALHDRGYVHRDLKAGNIMVVNQGARDESIKVLDFGLARKVNAPGDAPYIPIEQIREYTEGTPAYISPEQLGGGQVDHRADLYSLGVLLYELLTGRRPFLNDDVSALLKAHVEQSPPPFTQVGALGVGVKVENVVRTCLSKKPERRPQSARDLVRRYEEATGQRLWYEPVYQSMLPAAEPAAPVEDTAAAPEPTRKNRGGRNDTIYRLEAWMPESIAVMKLRGFLTDIGGEVTESVPGMVRVYLKHRAGPARPAAAAGGLLSWFGGAKKAAADDPTDLVEMEVHMEKHPSGKPNHLLMTLLLRVTGGLRPPDWHAWCEKVTGDLGAYLMAKKV